MFYAVVAPLLPAMLVAAAYDASDPTRELLDATPFSKLRIALLRTALAVAAALPVVVLMGVLVPGLESQRGALAAAVTHPHRDRPRSADLVHGTRRPSASLVAAWVVVVAAWATGASLDSVTSVGVQSSLRGGSVPRRGCCLVGVSLDARLTAIRPGGRS